MGAAYPNPTHNYSTFKINLQKKSSVEIIIYDRQGKQIVSKNEYYSKGDNEINIDTTSLKKGIYTYIIKVNNEKVISNELVKN